MRRYIFNSNLEAIYGENIEEAVLKNLNKLFIQFDRIDKINLRYNNEIFDKSGGVELKIVGVNLEFDLVEMKILGVKSICKSEWINAHEKELVNEKFFINSECEYIQKYNKIQYEKYSSFLNIKDFYNIEKGKKNK